MNTILNSRNIAIGVITLALGVFVALGMGKIWAGQTTTVNGNVVSFILNPEGKVEGAILDTGDQVKFGEQTGELVASNIQIGGVLSATGDVGTKSNYGRELFGRFLHFVGRGEKRDLQSKFRRGRNAVCPKCLPTVERKRHAPLRF
ncbi:MAG: AEC family transporter [Acidobacteriota bacterium]|nr:AEC family transporter [Acidobacteriota bacterium]